MKMTIKNATGTKAVSITNQDGSFYAIHMINVEGYHDGKPVGGNAIAGKWFKSLAAAERFAGKVLN